MPTIYGLEREKKKINYWTNRRCFRFRCCSYRHNYWFREDRTIRNCSRRHRHRSCCGCGRDYCGRHRRNHRRHHHGSPYGNRVIRIRLCLKQDEKLQKMSKNRSFQNVYLCHDVRVHRSYGNRQTWTPTIPAILGWIPRSIPQDPWLSFDFYR